MYENKQYYPLNDITLAFILS